MSIAISCRAQGPFLYGGIPQALNLRSATSLQQSSNPVCYAYSMQLLFDYPLSLDALDTMLATKAYENIWQTDGEKIVQALEKFSGLQFQQTEIHVIVHDGQSVSGMDGVPMRLNIHNTSLNEKRNALVHELAHRLLFGNGLYAPDDDADADEVRAFLFQGDVLREVFGAEMYAFWADLDPDTHSDDHRRLIAPILKLSQAERQEMIKKFTTA